MKIICPPVTFIGALSLSLSCVACGSSDDTAPVGDGADPPTTEQPPPTTTTPPDAPVDEPTDTALNDCGLDSGFPGDALCILPPDPSEGIQLSVGPGDYDDPDAVAAYILEPGGEDVVCFNDRAEAGGFYYHEQSNRMREGSHHMLIGLLPADSTQEGPTTECGIAGRIGSVPGAQTPARDVRDDDLAPEDEGIARWFPENAMANFQLHYVNASEDVVLREAWINLYWKDEGAQIQKLNSVFLLGDLGVNIAPHTREVTALGFEPTLPEETRIYSLGAHSHAHTERFTTWLVRDGQRELLYEDYDWEEPISLVFNTQDQNPLPNPAAAAGGGASGMLILQQGDRLEWECEVNNTLDSAIRFANEAYTAEMCLLTGAYISETPGLMSGGCSGGSCFAFGG